MRLALPITVGQLAIVGMTITDIIIAGRTSTDDLAGVALGGTIVNLAIMLVVGIVLGNGPIIGQLYGAGNFGAVRRQLQNCLWLCLPLGLLCTSLVSIGMLALPRLDINEHVANVTVRYLLPMLGTALLLPFMMALRTTFEGMGQARPAMAFNLIGFLANIPLDYALVLGKWGLPALGGAGCGWASFIVCLFIVAGEAWYARYANALRNYRLLIPSGRIDLDMIKETLRIGLPVGGAILSEGGFFMLIPLLIAHMGAVVVSGHTVAISFDWAMFMIPMGISQAISVLCAHEMGRQNPAIARRICFTGLGLTACIALIQAAFVIIFRDPIAALFSADPAVRELASHLLIYAAAFRVFDAINVGANGALRGYKDTRITVILAFTGYWIIGFPLSYSLALTEFWGTPLGVEGFWVGMVITLILISCLAGTRLNQTSRKALLAINNQP